MASPLSLSRTLVCLLDMEAMGSKSIIERLLSNGASNLNLSTSSDTESAKQSSIQYQIWKQSIERREQDEMILSVLINCVIISLALLINLLNNDSISSQQDTFSAIIFDHLAIFLSSEPVALQKYCE